MAANILRRIVFHPVRVAIGSIAVKQVRNKVVRAIKLARGFFEEPVFYRQISPQKIERIEAARIRVHEEQGAPHWYF